MGETAPPGGEWQSLAALRTPGWSQGLPDIHYRRAAPGRIELNFAIPAAAANVHGAAHGGWLAGMGEHTCAIDLLDRAIPCVTVALSLQYPAPAALAHPVTGILEVTGETGRMQFARLELSQQGTCVLFATATLRKFGP